MGAGGIVEFPIANYRITSSLIVPIATKVITLQGEGSGPTNSTAFGSALNVVGAINAITADNTAAATSPRLLIKDLHIVGDSATALTAIDLITIVKPWLENVYISGFTRGVKLSANCDWPSLMNCQIDDCSDSGVDLLSGGGAMLTRVYVNGDAAAHVGDGIRISANAENATLTSCAVLHHANGILIDGVAAPTTLISPWLESNTVGLRIGSTTATWLTRVLGGSVASNHSATEGGVVVDNGRETLLENLLILSNTSAISIEVTANAQRTYIFGGSPGDATPLQDAGTDTYWHDQGTAGGLRWLSGNTELLKIVPAGIKLSGTFGVFGTTPVTQNVLATGAGATVDNVITELQRLGLVRQS